MIGWGLDKFMATAKLKNPDFGYCINDSIVFKVEIALFSELEQINPFNGIDSDPRNSKLPSLSGCFKELLFSKEFSDVTLQIGCEQLNAHRLVLSVRSPVFRAMLMTNMSENDTGIIQIDDVEVEVMRECLVFMYTDACSSSTVSTEQHLPLFIDNYLSSVMTQN